MFQKRYVFVLHDVRHTPRRNPENAGLQRRYSRCTRGLAKCYSLLLVQQRTKKETDDFWDEAHGQMIASESITILSPTASTRLISRPLRRDFRIQP